MSINTRTLPGCMGWITGTTRPAHAWTDHGPNWERCADCYQTRLTDIGRCHFEGHTWHTNGLTPWVCGRCGIPQGQPHQGVTP